MSDKEIFEAALKSVVERYGLVVKHPYNDSYIEIYDSYDENEALVGLNPEGFSLLYNLKELSKLAEFVF